MQEFIKKNLWNLLVTLVAISTGWAFLSSRLSDVEALAIKNEKAIIEYSLLVQRVIVLEENRDSLNEHIKEIKEDLKDLKKYFNLL